MSGNYETEFAKYYLGISGPDKDRNSALNTALSNALEKAGVESSSIYIESVRKNISNSTTQQKVGDWRTSITGNSNSETFGETKKRFSSTIDKITLVEEYWDGNIGYALIRIPKTGYDSFNFHDWNVRENRKRKLMGGVRSAVLPGWGSFYQEKPMRGTFFLLSTLASAGYIYTAYSNYNNSIDLMNKSVIGSDKNRFFDEATGYSRDYNIGIISLSTLYLWSVLDPIIFPGEYRDYFYLKHRYNSSSRSVLNQQRYSDVISVSNWYDSAAETEVYKLEMDPLSFFLRDSDIPAAFIPKAYLIYYEPSKDSSALMTEFGVSLRIAMPKSNFIGIHPYAGIGASFFYATQEVNDFDIVAEQYDLGYGADGSGIYNMNLLVRVESGLQCWLGPFKLFGGFNFTAEQTANSWFIDMYDGGYTEAGDPTSKAVKIDADQIGVKSIKYGGSSILMGLSFGL